jgi:glycosyltransferase involved in cell wall biosynthesis
LENKKKNKILICIPVLLMGGTEIQVLTLIEVLIAGGYRTAVCCYYEFDQSIVEVYQQAGAETILLGLNRSDGRFGPSKIVELIRRLSKTFRKYRPDIVHVQYLAPGFIPIVAAKLARIPTIFATVHIAGSIAYGLKAKFLLRLASHFCTAFFCVSKGVEEFWFGNSKILNPANINRGRKHFTIYNAIDISKIEQIVSNVNCQELKKSLGIDGRPVVGIVGRLAPQKGHTFLLDAMVEVVKKIPNIVLLVIGDGPLRDSLKQRAKSLGIDQNIQWLGVIKQEEVFKFYSIMDIFAMPSLYEGFGLSAAEAMAAGLPVVGTKIEGLSEVIEVGVTGYLLPVGDSKAFANALIELLKNPTKREQMGEEGKHRVYEMFSLKNFSDSIMYVYEYFRKN